jgi:hypothetical protein
LAKNKANIIKPKVNQKPKIINYIFDYYEISLPAGVLVKGKNITRNIYELLTKVFKT